LLGCVCFWSFGQCRKSTSCLILVHFDWKIKIHENVLWGQYNCYSLGFIHW
jgi:hypothetical protein